MHVKSVPLENGQIDRQTDRYIKDGVEFHTILSFCKVFLSTLFIYAVHSVQNKNVRILENHVSIQKKKRTGRDSHATCDMTVEWTWLH